MKKDSPVALIDCNNFFASCQRVFEPKLENHPVAVLSSNDGCIVARSNEVKKLGVPMGAPYFKVKSLLAENNAKVFSSNFALYSDMSRRVMEVVKLFSDEIEIYSIDEAFATLHNKKDLVKTAGQLRNTIKKWTGIPVSIGIGKTKTQAKAAALFAKSNGAGVYELSSDNLEVLESFSVNDVWGIGGGLSGRLERRGIKTAYQLAVSNPAVIRRIGGIGLLSTALELRGMKSRDGNRVLVKKQIRSSRSFGSPIKNFDDLAGSLAYHCSAIYSKMREQGSLAGRLTVFVKSGSYKDQSIFVEKKFPEPVGDIFVITKEVVSLLEKIYKPGANYIKAGVMVADFQPAIYFESDTLFGPTNYSKQLGLLSTIDKINLKFGSNTLRSARMGFQLVWESKKGMQSPSYTGNWAEIPKAFCR